MGNESAPAAQKTEHKPEHAVVPADAPVIHRVCVQCNNMFRVTPENFDAKQCPNCHKG